MAKTTINARQLTITGSATAMDEIQSSLSNDAVFMMQVSGGSSPVQLIKAKDMQSYFSQVDLVSVTSGDYTFALIQPGGSPDNAATSGFDLHYDEDHANVLGWNAATDVLKISGSLKMAKDSGSIFFGESDDIILKHVADEGLRLSGSSFHSASLQFGDSSTYLKASSAGTLLINAGTKLDIDAGAIDITGSTVGISGSGAFKFEGAAGASFDYKQAVTIDSDSSLTLGGSAISATADGGAVSLQGSAASSFITTDGTVKLEAQGADDKVHLVGGHANGVAIHLHASGASGSIDLDANAEITADAVGGITLTSTEAAADAIVLHASDAAGGIDLKVNSTTPLSIDADSADFAATVQVNVDNATQASSTTSGALTVDGGVGIVKNLYVGGNLVVQGDTTTVETTNMLVEDPIVQLGSASAGNAAADGDRGFIFSLSGSASQAFWWDNSATEFVLAPTTSSAGGTEVAKSGSLYSKLHIGELDADGAGNFQGDLTAQAALTVEGLSSLNGNVILGDSASDTVVVNSNDVDFANLPTMENPDVDPSDSLMIRDSDRAKHITVAEYAEFLAFGAGAAGTNSNGLQASNGVLSIAAYEKVHKSSSMTSGVSASIDHSYATAILTGSFQVYLNGMLQLLSGSTVGGSIVDGDYKMDGTNVVMTEALDADDVLIIKYIQK